MPAADVEFRLTDATSHPVADAVVSLTPLDSPTPPSTTTSTDAPAALPEIMQQHQEFSPFVTAIRVGTAVRFPNRDTVQHHVYSLSKPKKFELPLYKPGQAETTLFEQTGIVTIGCNIHDWMLAYVVVLETPWFVVTPAGGTATLHEVPPGRYRAEVWQPRLAKPLTRELSIPADTAVPLAFSLMLKPDRRIRRTPNSDAGGYK